MQEDKIFISYAGKDSEIALKIANGLEKERYKTWCFERDSLGFPAEDWLNLIANAVMECGAFVLFISPDSIVSDMVDKEVNYAVEEKKEIFPLFYNITPDKARQGKPKWAFLFSGLNKMEITLSSVATDLPLIINWLKRIGIQPNLVQKQTKEIIGKDSAPMVLIPAGEFEMGSNDGGDDEKPVHTVYLDAFYMDKYEVTNALYKKFMDATGYKAPAYWDDKRFNDPQHPVVGVSWNDANEYCRRAGKRLPTEAEWEKSARGGLVGKEYPCGDTLTHEDANYKGTGGKDKWEYTSPVGSFAPNGYGLYDMAGNVLEWCADLYDNNYYVNSPKTNPKGPGSGVGRVLRGGSWGYNLDNFLRVADRYFLQSGRRQLRWISLRSVVSFQVGFSIYAFMDLWILSSRPYGD
jgi:formylglycine-generating enzyme required for sulfatase activity